MSKIKIVHLVSSLNIGGAERFVIDLSTLQQKQDKDVQIISTGAPNDILVNSCKQANIPVTVLTGSKFAKLLTMFLRMRTSDVVHVHSPAVMRVMSKIIRFLPGNIVYTRHGAAPLAAQHWVNLHKKVMRYIKYITFVSPEGQQAFHRTHGWKDTPSKVIANGVLLSDVVAKPVALPIRFGSVGRMVPLKNQISLLKAAAKLTKEQQQGMRIAFFGSGECESDLKDYVSEHLAEELVTFYGNVSEREHIYQQFDVLVVTSETEGLSMAILETMASRKATIATRVGGNPLLVQDTKTGWLIDYDKEAMLAERLVDIINNPSMLTETGENAYQLVKHDYSLDATLAAYDQIYFSE
ncbi:glycosyltransferase family 4 protein [Thalassotalea agarivorans]|nr:glycosyltransferase family 4 protein [Thalassotalea agarivorans]